MHRQLELYQRRIIKWNITAHPLKSWPWSKRSRKENDFQCSLGADLFSWKHPCREIIGKQNSKIYAHSGAQMSNGNRPCIAFNQNWFSANFGLDEIEGDEAAITECNDHLLCCGGDFGLMADSYRCTRALRIGALQLGGANPPHQMASRRNSAKHHHLPGDRALDVYRSACGVPMPAKQAPEKIPDWQHGPLFSLDNISLPNRDRVRAGHHTKTCPAERFLQKNGEAEFISPSNSFAY